MDKKPILNFTLSKTDAQGWDTYGFYCLYTKSAGGPVRRKWFRTRIEATRFGQNRPKPNAYEMIQFHMKETDKWTLARIRKANNKGEGWDSGPIGSHRTYNSLTRLKDAGRIKYNRRGSYSRKGYWIVTKEAK